MDKNDIQKNVDINRGQMRWACDAANQRTSEYSKFLTGVAGVIFGLSQLMDTETASQNIKIFFVAGSLCLILSLVFSAVHIWLERRFFDAWTDRYYNIFDKWNAALAEEVTSIEAADYEKSVYQENKSTSPMWSLICQGTFLFLGITAILVVIVLTLF